eukprot:15442914-Alexandrium_andersonii.AAC.1
MSALDVLLPLLRVSGCSGAFCCLLRVFVPRRSAAARSEPSRAPHRPSSPSRRAWAASSASTPS